MEKRTNRKSQRPTVHEPMARAGMPGTAPSIQRSKIWQRILEESAGEFLTTDQGVRINDNQNSLKAGDRGPTLLEDFILREKITHFDHERIPERVVHARGSAAHGYFQVYESMAQYTKADVSSRSFSQDACLCAFLNSCRFSRLDRSRARCAGFRSQVLHAGREFRSRRQQHSGLLYSGRDQVSGSGSRSETGTAQRNSAGRIGARHVLGFHLADAGIDAHDHVGDV